MTDQPPPSATPAASAGRTVYVQPAQPSNGVAVASLVLGIVGVVSAWIPVIGFIGLVCAIVGLIMGIVGLQRPYGRGVAIGGIICSAFALLESIVVFLLWTAIIGAAASAAH